MPNRAPTRATSGIEVSRMIYSTLREANWARHKEWFKDKEVSLLFRVVELVGEAGELANVVKKMHRENMGVRGTKAELEHLYDELADIVISADLLSMHLGVDMARIIEKKFNETSRKYRLKTRLQFTPTKATTKRK
jgi:NTP pyrophosphatase (non-canonical NTP hydrolase)